METEGNAGDDLSKVISESFETAVESGKKACEWIHVIDFRGADRAAVDRLEASMERIRRDIAK